MSSGEQRCVARRHGEKRNGSNKHAVEQTDDKRWVLQLISCLNMGGLLRMSQSADGCAPPHGTASRCLAPQPRSTDSGPGRVRVWHGSLGNVNWTQDNPTCTVPVEGQWKRGHGALAHTNK